MVQIADILQQQKIDGYVDGRTGIRVTWQSAGAPGLHTEFYRDEQRALNALLSLERCDRSAVLAVEVVPIPVPVPVARARRVRKLIPVRQLSAAVLWRA